jgi:ABC-type bacteriocin/lantibiotic exporter with double-glycine peptidase domain
MVLQAQATDCGLTSLAIVLGYFGHHLALEELRTLSGISRDGSSAALLVEMARHYGLEAKGYKKDIAGLRDVALPAIAHCRFNHFVVIEEVRDDGVVINDPCSGPRFVPTPEFSDDFTGVILTFQPSANLQRREKQCHFSRVLTKMLWPFRGWVILALAASVLGWTGPLLVARSLFTMAGGGWIAAARLLACAAGIAGLCAALEQWALGRLTARLHAAGSAQMLGRIAAMPADFFSYRFGGTISGLIESYEAIANGLCGLAPAALGVLAVPVLLTACAMYSARAAIIASAGLIASVAVFAALYAPRSGVYRRFVHEGARRPGLDPWQIREIERLKLGATPASVFSNIAGMQAISLSAAQAYGGASAILNAVQTGLTPLVVLAIVWACGSGARATASAAALALFCMVRVRAAGGQWPNADRLRALLIRVEDLPDQPAKPPDHASPAEDPADTTSRFGVRKLTFGYNRRRPALLRDISFELAPGKVLGFAGRPGSGRSTLARLICGLHSPWEGEILKESGAGGSVALVQAHAPFFEGSLRDNVTLWDPAISAESVARSLRDACLDEVVAERSGGADTMVSPGATNFSGGQRQRLAIARAVARDPQLLILDEATDALDPDLEAGLIANLRGGLLSRGGVCVLISLRPSTLALCDEIIVLEDGQIAERGAPNSLMAAGAAYQRLMRSVTHA